MTNTRPGKGYYNEAEAASSLGISLEDLRTLVRSRILENEDDVANLPMTSFQPSDLLLLRLMLAQGGRQQVAAL
jgi:hypothetical protein